MEQHPVPQNITSFQFRLVGDMTLKQFGYLAGGIILAYISYKLPLPFFFRWPLTVIFALGGFGFAFVPIEERPMDVWVLSFIKNVYSPTIFHWEYSAKKIVEPHVPASIESVKPMVPAAVKDPLDSLTSFFSPPKHTPTPLPPKPVVLTKKSPLDAFFSWIDSLFPSVPTQAASPSFSNTRIIPSVPPPMPSRPPAQRQEPPEKPEEKPIPPTPAPAAAKINPLKTEEELAVLKLQLEAVQKELSEKQLMETRVLELQKELSDISVQKQTMENELLSFKRSGAPQPSPFFKPTGPMTTKSSQEPTVKVMGTDAAIRAGIPRLTTFPNVVTGIVKDYDTNLLPGVLVTVKDKDGIPLRALKTNKLGQFAASTPLPNGTYVVEVEDPRGRYLFDRIQVTLVGNVMSAVMVIAKSKRQLDREILSKQIFGSPSANS